MTQGENDKLQQKVLISMEYEEVLYTYAQIYAIMAQEMPEATREQIDYCIEQVRQKKVFDFVSYFKRIIINQVKQRAKDANFKKSSGKDKRSYLCK
jgi:hypothetical protein